MAEQGDPRLEFAERLRALKDAAGVSVRDMEIASTRTPRRRTGQVPLRLKRSTIAGMISRTRPVCPEQENFEVFVDTCLRVAEESGRLLPGDLMDRQAWDAAYRELLLSMAGMRSANRKATDAAKRLRWSTPPPASSVPGALSRGQPGSTTPPGAATAPAPAAVTTAATYFGRRRKGILAAQAAAFALTGVIVAALTLWPISVAPTSGSTTANVGGDGVLRLGALVPWSGGLQFFSRPMAAGVRLAVDEINAAGGVFGRPVASTLTDSGDSTTDLDTQALTQLISGRADVVIGPVTSSMSLTMIDQAKNAGVVLISSTATTDELTDVDDGGLFFRTVASDAIQGNVLGQLIRADGGRRVGILALDDAYGTELSGHIRRSLERRGVTPVHIGTYDTMDASYATEVDKLRDSDPDAIVVVGATETSAIARELVRRGLGVDGRKWYFVDRNLTSYGTTGSGLPRGTLTGVKATMAGAEVSDAFRRRLAFLDPTVTDFRYAPEAYDATIVAALAALAAGRDDPKSIAQAMAYVTRDGERCTDFRTCAGLLDSGKDIDYDGASGPIAFTDRGDPATAPIGVYQYRSDNTYISLSYKIGEMPT